VQYLTASSQYFNDTQEIDIEFLSREFDRDKQIYPINLVIQSRDSLAAGYNAQHTGTYARVNLTFDPTAGFHEYRFDYVPGQVVFYADSVRLAEMKGREVPSSAGHLILQHWSNGNPLWSGGPPARDAILTVSYVKAYFNSSDAPKRAEWATACSAATNDKGDVCVVPDVTAANASDGGTFLGQSEDDKQRGGGGEGKPEVGGGGGGGVDQGESNVASRLSMGMLQCGSLVALLLALGQ
jgi:beta-glucanase (GH16 family)